MDEAELRLLATQDRICEKTAKINTFVANYYTEVKKNGEITWCNAADMATIDEMLNKALRTTREIWKLKR